MFLSKLEIIANDPITFVINTHMMMKKIDRVLGAKKETLNNVSNGNLNKEKMDIVGKVGLT